MSNMQLQGQEELDSSANQKQVRYMRWFLLSALFIFTLMFILVPSIVFLITRNLIVFSLLSVEGPLSYVWYRLAKYLLPLSEYEFRLALEKEKHKAQKNKKFVMDD